MMQRYEIRYRSLTIVATILAFFVGAIGMYLAIRFLPLDTATVTNINKTEKEVTVNEKGISDAVEKIYDSVVTVETYEKQKQTASGTGFVYKVKNNKAFVLTNNHVIDGGDEIFLVFTNGTRIEAKIVGKDLYADIAVLEIEESNIISVAALGSSETAKIGDTVFAVGAPLDSAYSWTVTRGIVSGKDRMVEVNLNNLQNTDWIMKVIQTDASINSGNSGGPLANSNGEVIGIASLKLVSTGVEGMGFAIPIEDALYYAEKIENGESLTRPFLGISMTTVNDIYNLQANNIVVDSKITNGVVVIEVTPESPADKASLKKGDVILEIEGKKCSSIAEFRYNLYKHEVDETINIKINRAGKELTVKAKLAANE